MRGKTVQRRLDWDFAQDLDKLLVYYPGLSKVGITRQLAKDNWLSKQLKPISINSLGVSNTAKKKKK